MVQMNYNHRLDGTQEYCSKNQIWQNLIRFNWMKMSIKTHSVSKEILLKCYEQDGGISFQKLVRFTKFTSLKDRLDFIFTINLSGHSVLVMML